MNSKNIFTKDDLWPELQWNNWRETAMTVHLFTQIVGKVRLGLMPMEVEWAQVPLTVTARGLSSTGMPTDFGSIDIILDFVSHLIIFYASDGRTISFSLKRHSVADFYADVQSVLSELNVKVKIFNMSVELPIPPVQLDIDNEHKTYDVDVVQRWWHLLISISKAFEKYRGGFWGKQTPVSFFWGGFDMAIDRYSGKYASPPPNSDMIYRVAMDAEQTAVGFWPGNDDAPEPIFFAYTYPKPDGIENVKVSPSDAYWSKDKGEFILPYEAVRTSDNPEKTLLDFCNSTFKAGAKLAGWDLENLERKPPLKKPK